MVHVRSYCYQGTIAFLSCHITALFVFLAHHRVRYLDINLNVVIMWRNGISGRALLLPCAIVGSAVGFVSANSGMR
jgi:hypothetical protein